MDSSGFLPHNIPWLDLRRMNGRKEQVDHEQHGKAPDVHVVSATLSSPRLTSA